MPDEKQIRFASLVEAAGQPAPYTLWVKAEKDAFFKQAVDDQRVLTVLQNQPGSRQDFGKVGFFQKPGAIYLVFPNSLAAYAGRKVIGIKYDQVASPEPHGRPVKVAQSKAVFPAVEEAPVRVSQPARRWIVRIRSQATRELSETIEAESSAQAKTAATESLKRIKPDFTEAEVRHKIVSIRKAK